jgi:Rrf2 family nitric oxide-sensitive transcriptional repressor
MHLTRQADYSLRVLLYLALHPDEVVPVGAIAAAYRVSAHHLAKVAQLLGKRGYVELRRGQTGGLRLLADPKLVRIGDVVRETEPSFELLECFNAETNTCPLDPSCALKGVFRQAERRFLEALDQYTIADMVRRPQAILSVLKPAGGAARAAARGG